METEVLKAATGYGIFAVLFCYLLFYVLRQNSNREDRYQDIISKLTEKFDIVSDIKKDVDEIKDALK